MSEHNIEGIMNITMDNLKALVDADTIIGTPITIGEVTLVPVSKVSFGLATGGSDFPTKQSPVFGGGGGAGVTVTPIAFISICNGSVKMLQINNEQTAVEKIIESSPELIRKFKEVFEKKTVIEE